MPPSVEQRMDKILHNRLGQWLLIALFFALLRAGSSKNITKTLIESAVAKGAVCLDGSPPAYYLDRGSGKGIQNWLIHIEGGGWCQNPEVCQGYTKMLSGSSTLKSNITSFSGILSSWSLMNPDFHDWNRVRVGYCDGGSFTGDVEEVDPDTKLYYRGSRIFSVVMEELLEQGMRNATNVLLSGCSAGGLTTILHCDAFRSLFPKKTKVKCLADAGFFVNFKDIAGEQIVETFFDNVLLLHASTKNLPKQCTSKMKPSLCYFPQYILKNIRTPLFIVNSAIDNYQIAHHFVPTFADPLGLWVDCKFNSSKCTENQLKAIQGVGAEIIKALKGAVSHAKGIQYFISNFQTHCQTEKYETWSEGHPMLKNRTIAKAVADWFYNGTRFQEIDYDNDDESSPDRVDTRLFSYSSYT